MAVQSVSSMEWLEAQRARGKTVSESLELRERSKFYKPSFWKRWGKMPKPGIPFPPNDWPQGPPWDAPRIIELEDATEVMPGYTRGIRSKLPELATYSLVDINFEMFTWTVTAESFTLRRPMAIPLVIMHCPVFIHEPGRLTYADWMTPPCPHQCDSLNVLVHPRRMVNDEDCRRIAKRFPSSIGMRVFLHSYIHILYATEQDIRHDIRNSLRFPNKIDQLCWGFEVLDHRKVSKAFIPPSQLQITFAQADEILDTPRAAAFFHIAKGDDGIPREAVISGAEYFWQRKKDDMFLEVRQAIIWRTEPHKKGKSGELLYLGKPGAEKCTAALHQDFESYCGSRSLLHRKAKTRYEGGWLSPREVTSRGALQYEPSIDGKSKIEDLFGPDDSA